MSRSGRPSRSKGKGRPRAKAAAKGNRRPEQRKDKLWLAAVNAKPRRSIDWNDTAMMHMAAEAQPDYEPPYPAGPLGEE